MLKIQIQRQNVHAKGQVKVLELTKLLGLLVSAIQEVLPDQMKF